MAADGDSEMRTPRSRNRSALGLRHSSMMSLSNMSSAPKWSMMGKPRPASADKRSTVPDPGSYTSPDPEHTSKMPRSPKAAFGASTCSRKVLEQDMETTPGPGAYSLPEGKGSKGTPAFTETPRARERRTRTSTPDPGSYTSVEASSTSKMGRSPSYGFANSRASRFPTLKERAPGPGAYQRSDAIGGKDGVGPSFLGSPRQRERTPLQTPDPGVYSPIDPESTSKMPRTPRASFMQTSTGRLNGEAPKQQATKVDPPGPGAYLHKEDIGGGPSPSFTRTPRQLQLNRAESPDPGVYQPVDPSATSKMQKQIALSFGTLGTGRVPEVAVVNEERDDGEVVQTNVLVGPKKQDVPGPGAYNVGTPTVTSSTAPRWGFGSLEARPTLIQRSRGALHAQLPGPGSYPSATSIGQGPKFSIRNRAADRRTSTPGPGEYGGHYTQFV